VTYARVGALTVVFACLLLSAAAFAHPAQAQSSLRVGSRVSGPLLERLGQDATRRPLVVAFWASWCETCREELPALAMLQERYRGRLRVVAISIDQDRPTARRTMDAQGVGLPAVEDDGLSERFGARSRVPSTFFIGADGRVRYVQRGFRGGLNRLEATVAAALGEET